MSGEAIDLIDFLDAQRFVLLAAGAVVADDNLQAMLIAHSSRKCLQRMSLIMKKTMASDQGLDIAVDCLARDRAVAVTLADDVRVECLLADYNYCCLLCKVLERPFDLSGII